MRVSSVLTLSIAGLIACGGDPATGLGTGNGGNPGGGGTTNAIQVDDDFFSPTSTSVLKGTTVTWTFVGQRLHNVTFDNGSGASADKTTGTYSRTFDAIGVYDYRCSIHGAAMTGKINVQ